MLEFLEDLKRRQTNAANLALLKKGICPHCNEHAVYEHNGIYECHKCHTEYRLSYNHPVSFAKKPTSYK